MLPSSRQVCGCKKCARTQPLPSLAQHTPQTQIDAGTKELVKAEQTQKSGRALSCIALLLVLVVVFLIATIVRHA